VKFVIDEDLPRSTAKILSANGFEVYDIRDHGLRGGEDEAIFAFAQEQKAVLITGDLGFGNQLKYPVSGRLPRRDRGRPLPERTLNLGAQFAYSRCSVDPDRGRS